MICFIMQITKEELESVKKDVIQKTVKGMSQDGIPYVGQ